MHFLMMNLDILESASNDHMFVKGKRTKRPRPSSSTSSKGGAAADFYPSLPPSPTTSTAISTSTEEDEDMANCLILLARGNSPTKQEIKTPATTPASAAAEESNSTTGKVDIFVYECKTCNRTFPSFQALGGHRASHKKPKTTAEVDREPPSPAAEVAAPPSNDLEERVVPYKSVQSDPNKSKMHECSICGSEFGSGQALGGHMRRHRPVTKIPTSIDDDTASFSHVKTRNVLGLDLNLPPPENEKLPPFAAEEQRRVVFSAAALVDCYY